MTAVLKLKIHENVVQNSVPPSTQLLRSIGSLITTSGVHVCHHHSMGFPLKAGKLKTIKRSRTEPRKGPKIGWELVLVLLNTVGPLICHCVSNYPTILQKKIVAHA